MGREIFALEVCELEISPVAKRNLISRCSHSLFFPIFFFFSA